MTAGRVSVNGRIVTELGSKVDPHLDEVRVDGVVVRMEDGPTTLMLNKPVGFLTTMSDPHADRCVADLVPTADHPGLFPVGRLDKDTTGLLLFSTDGEMGNALLHPRHHMGKTYVAQVRGRLDDGAIASLRDGIMLDGRVTAPAGVDRLDRLPSDVDAGRSCLVPGEKGTSFVRMVLHEGRTHQVKLMCEAVGCPVAHLHRCGFGPLSLGDLDLGAWRILTEAEVRSLKHRTCEGACDEGDG